MAVTFPSETTRRLPTATRELLIGGEWVAAASGQTFETHDPGTGELLATVAEGGAHDIDLAVQAARLTEPAKSPPERRRRASAELAPRGGKRRERQQRQQPR